ncbi:MAG: glycosyltransferase family protein [Bdellovibrionota bacterium]
MECIAAKPPSQTTRVLFVIGGFGLGNSTRCGGLIESLARRGVEIDVATSNNGLWYFQGSGNVRNLFSIHSFSYGSRDGQLSFLASVCLIPIAFIRLILNAGTLLRLQRQSHYQWIAVDSEYSAFLIRWLLRTPLVAINNVFFTFASSGSTPAPLKKGLFFHYLLEKLDHFLQSTLSDFKLSPCFFKNELPANSGISFFSSLVRSPLLPFFSKTSSLRHALVICSGSGLGITHQIIKKLSECDQIKTLSVVGAEGLSTHKISYFGRQKNLEPFFLTADFIVSNAGFSTISEAIALGKKILTFPIPRHYEQHINADYIERNGLGIRSEPNSINKDLTRLQQLIDSNSSDKISSMSDNNCEDLAAATQFLINIGK